MEKFIMLGMLLLYSIEDWKKKRITVRYLLLFAVVGGWFHFYYRNCSIYSILGGMAVGIGIIAVGFFSGGQIGIGDGLLLIVTGIFLGGNGNLKLFMISLLYAALWSLLMLAWGKKRKHEIPFIPFVLAGYLTILLGVAI